MKITFNDASELTIQSAEIRRDGSLLIKTISASEEELRTIFQDEFKTKRMIITERESTIATYENYTYLNAVVKYIAGILGVTLYEREDTPEIQKEVQSAAIMVARYQAQSLDDAEALEVKVLYPEWSADSVAYSKDYKVQYGDVLYKCAQEHTSQSDWAPGVAPSLWTAIANPTSEGTKDNPIPVPETVTTAGMEYQKGKYYSWKGKTYLMTREDTTLYFAPADLVGQYFEEV